MARGDRPGVRNADRRRWARSLALKRLIDVTLAGVGLLLAAPVILAIGIAIRATIGPPVFFRQLRPGRKGRPFVLVKFRSMRDAWTPDGRMLPDLQRRTRIGDLIRRTGLDELPELWNVLRGDMSIVGPRPLLMEYLDTYSPEEARRHDVRPGIAGWAQIHGHRTSTAPACLDLSERLRLDVWYVDNWSLGLDLRIIVRTLELIVRGGGPGTTQRPVEGPGDAGAEVGPTVVASRRGGRA